MGTITMIPLLPLLSHIPSYFGQRELCATRSHAFQNPLLMLSPLKNVLPHLYLQIYPSTLLLWSFSNSTFSLKLCLDPLQWEWSLLPLRGHHILLTLLRLALITWALNENTRCMWLTSPSSAYALVIKLGDRIYSVYLHRTLSFGIS